MILVTLGTQKQQFTRILDVIEKSNINDEIIVQAGHTKYESKKMKIMDFISYDEMEKLVDRANIIITHGGTGSIVEPLKKGKKIIACARLQKYGEHVDNHQEELVSIFSEQGYILELKDNDELEKIIEEANKFTPNKYESNTENFIDKLKQKISNNTKSNKTSFIISLILFVTFLIISAIIPKGGDDWTGMNMHTNNLIDIGKMAIERYKWQEGRIISRFFVVFFQNTEWLWNIFNALMISGMYYLICKIADIKSRTKLSILLALSIIYLNSVTFTQSYLWIAGNCTYVVPMFFCIIYFYIMNRIWKSDFNQNKITIAICCLLNFLASMMVENVGASLVFANFLLVLYGIIKNKKIDKKILVYFVISLAGFLVMLLSPGAANRLVTQNTEFSKLSVIEKCLRNFPNFIKYTYLENNILMLLLTVMLYCIINKNIKGKIKKTTLYIYLVLPIITIFVRLISIMENKSGKVRFLIKYIGWINNADNIFVKIYWTTFTLALLYFVYRYIKEKDKPLFYLFVGLSSNLALLLSPLSEGRTSLFTIYMLYIFTFIIFGKQEFLNMFDKFKKLNSISLKLIFTFTIILLLVIYSNVYIMQLDREKIINESIEKDSGKVELLLFPEKILHNLNAWNEIHQREFKIYYNINEDAVIERIKSKWLYSIIYMGY